MSVRWAEHVTMLTETTRSTPLTRSRGLLITAWFVQSSTSS
jgi:hypothetical protein